MAMAKARYYKIDGKKGRARELPEALFDGVVNDTVLHQVVKAHRANQRQGTGSAKNRSDVRGGSRKPWRQKGTGRARQGSIRSPQWVGGGRAFPPQPHSWRQRVPRKMRALARRSAFNARAGDDRVVLVDALEFEAPKTRRLRELLETMEVEGKILILTHGQRENLLLSANNLQHVLVRPFGEESTYDVLWAGTVIIERPALEAWEAGNGAATQAEPVEEEAVEDEPAEEAAVEAEAAEEPAEDEAVKAEAAEADTPAAEADEADADQEEVKDA